LPMIPTDPSKAAALVREADCPADLLAEFAKSRLPFLREGAARHRNTPLAVLETLVPKEVTSTAGGNMALILAANPRATTEILTALLRLVRPGCLDGSMKQNLVYEDLVLAAVCHPKCPDRVALDLLSSGHVSRPLRLKIAETSPFPSILLYLSQDPSEVVRRVALSRPQFRAPVPVA
jgi:hypothetical protein